MESFTRGECQATKNLAGTWTISTEDTHIADVDRHFNAHLIKLAPELYSKLIDARNQIEYLHSKFKETRSGNAVITQINYLFSKVEGKITQ
jgi:hypothetical protein